MARNFLITQIYLHTKNLPKLGFI